MHRLLQGMALVFVVHGRTGEAVAYSAKAVSAVVAVSTVAFGLFLCHRL